MTTRKYPRSMLETSWRDATYAGSIYAPRSEVGIARIVVGLALYGACFAAMLVLLLASFDVLVK